MSITIIITIIIIVIVIIVITSITSLTKILCNLFKIMTSQYIVLLIKHLLRKKAEVVHDLGLYQCKVICDCPKITTTTFTILLVILSVLLFTAIVLILVPCKLFPSSQSYHLVIEGLELVYMFKQVLDYIFPSYIITRGHLKR